MGHQINKRMRIKTVNKVIEGKINDWLSTVTDEGLRERLRKGVMVSGGCITSMLIGEKVNDYDIYFNSKQLTEDCAMYYVNKFNKTNYPVQYQQMLSGEKLTPIDDGKVSYPQVTTTNDGLVGIYIKSKGFASENNKNSASLQYEYFEKMEEDAAADYVEKAIGHALDKEKENTGEPYRPVYLSSNAITLSDRVQLITRFYGAPSEVHKNFDFVHAMCYWTLETGCVVSIEAMDAMNSKTLIYNGSKFPLCSQFRIAKFVARGWHINAGQQFKIQKQIADLDLNNLRVLRDQLTGVDVAYFAEILGSLESAGVERVDNTYLMTLIDKMFS